MKIYLTIILLIIFIFTSFSVLAESFQVEILKKLFIFDKNQLRYLFSNSFLQQVSIEQVKSIIDDYSGVLGDLNDVEKTENGYLLIFENGTAPAQININEENRISGLWFGNYILTKDDLQTLLDEFKKISGKISISVIKNNSEKIISYNDQQKMAVGSAFKLHLLKKLYDLVENSNKEWSNIIRLTENNRSLPTGILQEWPVGTPITLRTLSILMISQSDNTATDHIFDYIGRDVIETGLTEKNIPFLKTREFFILKFSADSNLQNKYINSSLEEKRKILENISTNNLNGIRVGENPILIDDLEWYFTTEELAKLIFDLKDKPEIKVNSGLVQKEKYYLAGFKGGSEPGVLQFTQIIQKSSTSDIYAISVTINNDRKSIDTNKTAQLVSRIISVLPNN